MIKTNSLFYIIGAGLSYIDVTEEEWKYIEDKHTLTFARVPYGSRKFEYYMSIERDYLDKSVLTYMAKLGYFDTRLLLYLDESIKLARELGFPHIKKLSKQTFYFMPSRRPWFYDENEPPNSFDETISKSFRQPLFRFRGQLIAAINSALILGATEIRLIGIDLDSQYNFYDTEFIYKCCRDNEIIESYRKHLMEISSNLEYPKEVNEIRGFDPKKMHTTNAPIIDKTWGKPLKGVTDVIKWLSDGMKENHMEGIFITNKKSLLYIENKLKFKSIMED